MIKHHVRLLISLHVIIAGILTARSLDVIIFPETGVVENAYQEPKYIFFEFADAIQQKTAPIIVSGAILHNFLSGQWLLADQLMHDKETTIKKIDHYKKLIEQEHQAQQDEKQKEQDCVEHTQKFEKLSSNEQLSTYTQYFDLYMKYATDIINSTQNSINLDLETKDFLKNNPHIVRLYTAFYIPFNFNEWIIYKHIQEDCYVLIPAAYQNKIDKDWVNVVINYAEKIEATVSRYQVTRPEIRLGFLIDHPDILKRIDSIKELKNSLSNWENIFKAVVGKFELTSAMFFEHPKKFLDAVRSMLVQGTEKDLFGSWNIYISGHGSESIIDASQVTFKEKVYAAIVGSYIASLPLEQFKELLTFFQNNMLTTLVYWVTCYGGGYHAEQVANYLNNIRQMDTGEIRNVTIMESLSRDFIAVSGSLTDAPTSTAPLSSQLYGWINGHTILNFQKFFDKLRQFEQEKTHAQKMLAAMQKMPAERRETFLKHLFMPAIAEALKAITYRNESSFDQQWLYSIPIIHIAGCTSFRMSQLWNDIVVIDKKTLAIQSKDQPLTFEKTTMILLDESNITVPIMLIGTQTCLSIKVPIFLSMITGNTIHRIESMTVTADKTNRIYSNDLKEFIRDAFLQLPEQSYLKIFMIKELLGVTFEHDNDKVSQLEDVIIARRPAEQENTLEATILFSCKNQSGDKNLFFKGEWNNEENHIEDWQEITEFNYAQEKIDLLQDISKK